MTDKKLVRIVTAGSVDDGKSTLIGRLLYETNSLTTDKIEAIKKSSTQKGYDYLDLSLATDGLIAEREQGITIDVAHIYFSTNDTNFIIADAPGHVEYTRNMVTGASNAQVGIILIDARNGIIEQTYRHFFICNLLKLDRIIVAINKMDLVAYDQKIFNSIVNEFKDLVQQAKADGNNISFIPVSALEGENITSRSGQMPWYTGNDLLTQLGSIKLSEIDNDKPFRFPIQHVIRPKAEAYHDFRGYSGKVISGTINVNDEVLVLPSGNKSKVRSINFFKEKYKQATTNTTPVLTLQDEVNVSRGDMLVKPDELSLIEGQLNATICLLNTQPLKTGNRYLLQHTTNRVLVKVSSIINKVETDYSGAIEAEELCLNDIGNVTIKLSKPIFADAYGKNKQNGNFILINEQTNDTVAVGFIN